VRFTLNRANRTFVKSDVSYYPIGVRRQNKVKENFYATQKKRDKATGCQI